MEPFVMWKLRGLAEWFKGLAVDKARPGRRFDPQGVREGVRPEWPDKQLGRHDHKRFSFVLTS